MLGRNKKGLRALERTDKRKADTSEGKKMNSS